MKFYQIGILIILTMIPLLYSSFPNSAHAQAGLPSWQDCRNGQTILWNGQNTTETLDNGSVETIQHGTTLPACKNYTFGEFNVGSCTL